MILVVFDVKNTHDFSFHGTSRKNSAIDSANAEGRVKKNLK